MSTLIRNKTVKKAATHRRAPRAKSFVSLDAQLTVDDWLALPETKPRYELIDGRLFQDMTTTSDHAWAAAQILIALSNWAEEKGWRFFAEGMAFKVDERNGFVPDVVGFRPGQKVRPGITEMPAPFLVVEILSPGTAKQDKTLKREFYAKGEIPIYVIVDTGNRTLEIFRLAEDQNRYGEPEVLGANDSWKPAEFPGLQLPLKKLWMD